MTSIGNFGIFCVAKNKRPGCDEANVINKNQKSLTFDATTFINGDSVTLSRDVSVVLFEGAFGAGSYSVDLPTNSSPGDTIYFRFDTDIAMGVSIDFTVVNGGIFTVTGPVSTSGSAILDEIQIGFVYTSNLEWVPIYTITA